MWQWLIGGQVSGGLTLFPNTHSSSYVHVHCYLYKWNYDPVLVREDVWHSNLKETLGECLASISATELIIIIMGHYTRGLLTLNI